MWVIAQVHTHIQIRVGLELGIDVGLLDARDVGVQSHGVLPEGRELGEGFEALWAFDVLRGALGLFAALAFKLVEDQVAVVIDVERVGDAVAVEIAAELGL